MKKIDNKIISLIMIGGQSKRMGGGIKSFVEFNNKKIFDRIIERIKPQIKKIIINSNTEIIKIKKYNYPIIKDLKIGYLGPLAGIHAGMHWAINNDPEVEWLVTLPGDTPFIPNNLIKEFKRKFLSNSKIIFAKSNNKIHPVIGAWHISLYKNLDIEINRGVRKILSWANLHEPDYVDFTNIDYDPFFNINTKEDLKIATEIEKNFFATKT